MDAPKTILVAADRTPASAKAIDVAASIAVRTGATVTLLRVREIRPLLRLAAASAGIEKEPEAEDLQTREEARQWTEDRAQPLREQGLPVETVVIDAEHRAAADAIVRYARDHHPDLLVIGSHGRGELQSLVLGSVADKVVRGAPCSVLVAR